MRATALLVERGVSIAHLHVSTLKPFSDPAVVQAVSAPKHGVITMENHVITGGLGTCVAEVMAENGIGKPLVRLGIRNTYAQGASFPYLMRKHGIDAMALVRRVETMMGEEFGISEADFDAVRLQEAASIGTERLEAL